MSEQHKFQVRDGSAGEEKLPERRGFLAKFLAVTLGGIAGLVPFASGLAVFMDPMRRRAGQSSSIRVATIDALTGERPKMFPVIADRSDAWNLYPNEPIGTVFLRKLADGQVQALNAVCPHAGCIVDFSIEASQFKCPCHASGFETDGKRIAPESCPSPRDLDSLEVDTSKLQQGEIWVVYKNFRAGTMDKIDIEK